MLPYISPISPHISPTSRLYLPQVDEATVRNFTKLAAHEQAPRFLYLLYLVYLLNLLYHYCTYSTYYTY